MVAVSAMEAKFRHGQPTMIDITPVGAMAAGEIIEDLDLAQVAHTDIAAGRLGAVSISGIYEVKKAAGGGVTFAKGAKVEWDATGNTAVAAAAGDFAVGIAVAAAADGDSSVLVQLNGNPILET